MATTLRFKRRVTGAAGAPTSLKTAEVAYNMVDGIFYVGFGDDGSGNATSIKAFAKDDFVIGQRVPTGGSTGYVLTKNSTTDYDFSWAAAPVTLTQGSGILISSNQINVDYSIVQRQGVYTAALSGNTATVTAANASYGAISVTGTLTANGTLIVPNSGNWVVANNTTGAFTLTVKTASGTGVVIAQGAARDILADGTNVVLSTSDFSNISLPGTVVGVTQTVGDNSTKLATTAYVGNSLSGYALLASPAFTGIPTAPTAAGGTNTTQIATTAFVTTALGAYAPTASPTFTGVPVAPTPATGTNTTQIATTAYVQSNLANYATTSSLSSYAPLASPALTGTPTAPTAATATNTTQIATTAFVQSNLSNYLTTATAASTYLSQATAASTYAPLASPGFTGTPTAPTPTAGDSSTKIATTAFVSAALGAQIQGVNWKQVVRAVAVANVASMSGTTTIDGVSLVAGDRVLLVGQTTASQNGIWIVAAGSWTRAPDMDVWSEVIGATVMVTNGNSYAGHGFTVTNDPDVAGTINSTNITFIEFTGTTDITNSTSITKSGNSLNVVVTGSGITIGGSGVALTGTLPSLSTVTQATDTMPYFTGSTTAASTPLTSFGRSLIDDADAATARVTLGLGSMATQAASAVAITGGTIDGVTLDGGTF